MSIPKHRLIMWMTVLEKLKTREILWKINVLQDKSCLICGDFDENTEHLFFGCVYSSECLSHIKEWANWRTKKINLSELIKWIRKKVNLVFGGMSLMQY